MLNSNYVSINYLSAIKFTYLDLVTNVILVPEKRFEMSFIMCIFVQCLL